MYSIESDQFNFCRGDFIFGGYIKLGEKASVLLNRGREWSHFLITLLFFGFSAAIDHSWHRDLILLNKPGKDYIKGFKFSQNYVGTDDREISNYYTCRL